MKLVNRETFLSLPPGTVYVTYESGTCGHLSIKGDNCGNNDWFFTSLETLNIIDVNSSAELYELITTMECGDSIELDCQSLERDGTFDDDIQFFVYTQEDINKLITVLTNTLKE